MRAHKGIDMGSPGRAGLYTSLWPFSDYTWENSLKTQTYLYALFDRSPSVSTFGNFFLHQEYAAIAARGDPLNEIESLINWELFRPRLVTVYQSDTDQGGRPHTDVVVLLKLLVLQQWYGLSDYELERQAGDRISFPPFSWISCLGSPTVRRSGPSRIACR